MSLIKGRFDVDDIAQQLVGGLLVGGPFIVTEEVWNIASEMNIFNIVATFAIVIATGYGILYVAVLRDPEVEASVIGFIPLRLISLVFVAYLSSVVIALSIGAPRLFTDTSGIKSLIWIVFKASTTVSIFTVIGAGTVDSVFGEPKQKTS